MVICISEEPDLYHIFKKIENSRLITAIFVQIVSKSLQIYVNYWTITSVSSQSDLIDYQL